MHTLLVVNIMFLLEYNSLVSVSCVQLNLLIKELLSESQHGSTQAAQALRKHHSLQNINNKHSDCGAVCLYVGEKSQH